LWHADLLLGNDREICSCTTAVARQWLSSIPTNMNATIEELLGEVFSMGSVPRLYNEDHLPLAVSLSRVE
jgi:hypothetical protein